MNAKKISGVVVLGMVAALSLSSSLVRAEEAATTPEAQAPRAGDLAANAEAGQPVDTAPSVAPASPAAPAVEGEAKHDDTKKVYVCEKDQISKDAPGKCEKCGGDLVEKAVTSETKKEEAKPEEPKKDEPKKEEAPK